MTVHSASRGLIEAVVRDRVGAIGNVSISHGVTVSGLITDGDVVTGARTSAGDLRTDLIVDCTGRQSRATRRLTDAGLPSPRLEEVGVDIWYAQTVVREAAGAPTGPDITVIQPVRAAAPRGGHVLRIEGDQTLVNLAGYFGDRAPTDPEGYLAYADSLPAPDAADLLRRAEAVGEVTTCGFKPSRRFHHETTPPPAGLLPLGDSMCSFNPFSGRGMTVAALEAVALDDLLGEHGLTADLPGRAVRAFSDIVADPRQIAAGDLAYPDANGRRTPVTRLSNAYARLVLRATTVDPVVASVMLDVQALWAPLTALMTPPILARTLWAQRAWRRNQSTLRRAGAGADAPGRASGRNTVGAADAPRPAGGIHDRQRTVGSWAPLSSPEPRAGSATPSRRRSSDAATVS